MQTELAWAAGFFDGEGYVGAVRHGPNNNFRRAQVSISQSGSPETLKRFYEAVGCGKILPQKKYKAHYKPVWRFYACKLSEVEGIFTKLKPYLSSIKFKQFDAVVTAIQEYKKLPRGQKGWSK